METKHIGRDDFKDLHEDLILIAIPRRRWGKSLNFDMLKMFLSVEVNQYGYPVKNNSNRVLFTGGKIVSRDGNTTHYSKLKIADVEDGKYMSHQGKYPVIAFPLKDIAAHYLQL